MARVPDGGPAEMLWILGRHAGLVGNDLSPIGTGVGDLNSTSANAAPFPFMMSSTRTIGADEPRSSARKGELGLTIDPGDVGDASPWSATSRARCGA